MSCGCKKKDNLIKTISEEEGIRTELNFFEKIPMGAVALIICLVIIILSFVMILTVYGRFFKMYLYTAIAPLPLSTFASSQTEHTGRSFKILCWSLS